MMHKKGLTMELDLQGLLTHIKDLGVRVMIGRAWNSPVGGSYPPGNSDW